MKPKEFVVDDGVPLQALCVPPTVQKMITFLESQPDNKLWSGRGLSVKVGASPYYYNNHGLHPALHEYRRVVAGKNRFGSRAAMKALDEFLKHQ